MSETQNTTDQNVAEVPGVDEESLINTDRVVLVYMDAKGEEHDQPLGDLPEIGGLIDGETGDDMTLIGVRVLTLAEVERRAWAAVNAAMQTAKAMHFDDCHKIYLSMDDEEVENMKSLGYDVVAPDLALLNEWFDSSCGLRLISAVHTNETNPNAGYISLIPQGFLETTKEDATDNVYVR